METSKPWYRLKEEELLNLRIRDLPIQVAGNWFAPLIQKLYAELTARELRFRPPCFLADEWFVPVNIAAVGIPFFLAHQRLQDLEEKMVLEVEGGTEEWFMQLIRHETGHAYSYAYNLHKRARWRKLFGSPANEYPDTYQPRPYSRSHVVHLDNWYAQSHPDEDFAESFAVWLTPGMNWRKRYRNWRGALEKLEYVDQLMTGLKGKTPKNRPRFRLDEYDGLGIKLKTYYRRKRKEFEESYPDFYDTDLRRIFTNVPEEHAGAKAAQFLRASHSTLVGTVSRWTRAKKYTIDELAKDLRERCRELNLYVRKNRKVSTEVDVAAYITSLVTTYLHTGKFKRTK